MKYTPYQPRARVEPGNEPVPVAVGCFVCICICVRVIYLAVISHACSLTLANSVIFGIQFVIRGRNDYCPWHSNGGCATSPRTIGRYPTQREPSLTLGIPLKVGIPL